MSNPIALPLIKRSPATLQYRIKATRPAKFYKPKFVLDPADRAKTIGAEWLRTTDPMMPSYPYGIDVRYPEANEGLYGGMSIQSGNKISSGRNKGKTLRKWYPNVKVERIKSEALGRELTIPIATRVMRTIRKVGGLDQYLTGEKPARVKELGLLGWKLRWMIVNSKLYRLHYSKQQAALGQATPRLERNPLDEKFEEAWMDDTKRAELVEKQNEKWEQLREKNNKFKTHFMQNILSDKKTKLRIPDIKTLSFYNPEALGLRGAEVKEKADARGSKAAQDVSY